MNASNRGPGKGNDENIRRYSIKKNKMRLAGSIVMLVSAAILLVVILVVFIIFGFRIRTIDVVGASSYTDEEILSCAGISEGDNILSVSESSVENVLKERFPYIRSVYIEKDYPSRLVLNIVEEHTTFYFELDGEYFLFNHSLKVIDRFDSEEALLDVRRAVKVKMPLVKSCIVSQYIELAEGDEYVGEFISQLSENFPASSVSDIDLTDKYYISMVVSGSVSVVIGDCSNLPGKLEGAANLLGDDPSLFEGNIDISVYPDCYYDLDNIA